MTAPPAYLYVHPCFHRRGVGRALALHAERIATDQGADAIWLTAWSGNQPALAFYRALGHEDLGASAYAIEGRSCENRVLRKTPTKR